QGIVERSEEPAAIEEAVEHSVSAVSADDLAHIVDAVGLRSPGGQGIVEGGEGAVAVEEAVGVAVGSSVRRDDLTRIVDVVGKRDLGITQRVVEAGIGAAAVEEAVDAGDVAVRPDDLA